MPALKLTMPSFVPFALRSRVRAPAAPALRREPLPPVLVVEGSPDPSLRAVIEETAERLGAAVSEVEDVGVLSQDPDRDAVLAVVLTRPRTVAELPDLLAATQRIVGDRPVVALTARPLSTAAAASHPVRPWLVAPPVTVEGLLFALQHQGRDRD